MDKENESVQNCGESYFLSEQLKVCTRCKIAKTLEYFHKTKKNKDGLKHICKDCSKIVDKEYREKNKEKLKKSREENKEQRILWKKDWDEKNKEHVKQYNKEYVTKNKDAYSKRANDFYHKNKERIKKRRKEIRLQNPELSILKRALRRSKELSLTFDITIDDILIPAKCPILGIELATDGEVRSRPSLDRIVPELGYIKSNVQVISHKANTMKSNATPYELLNFAKWVRGFGFESKPAPFPQYPRWYSQVRARAKSFGIPFDLSVEDFILYDRCPILGIPLAKNTGSTKPNSATVDRIIPSIGYVPDNVHIISYKANTMKNDASMEELELFALWIESNIPKLIQTELEERCYNRES